MSSFSGESLRRASDRACTAARVEENWPTAAFRCSPDLGHWLEEQKISLCISAYQSARLILVSSRAQRVQVDCHQFAPSMGLAVTDNALLVGTPLGIWALRREGQDTRGLTVFRASRCWVTGQVKVHDLGMDVSGRPLFVNTLYNCLAKPRPEQGFEPFWQPSFISAMVAEDRCHLNGLAMESGRARYVTCLARTDESDGWRERPAGRGLVIEVDSHSEVVGGLNMPHSPRLFGGRLWLHDSGSGWFGFADLRTGRFDKVAFCPGFLRGLTLRGRWAVAGLSKWRHRSPNTAPRWPLPIDAELEARGLESECGVYVIDTETGRVEHVLQLDGVPEIYDVCILERAARPALRLS